MRLSKKLFAQHLGWVFKKHWASQSKRCLIKTENEIELRKTGLVIKDVRDRTRKESARTRNKLGMNVGIFPVMGDTQWNSSRPCFVYGNNDVLIGGLQQALSLTKSVEILSLPKSIDKAMDFHINGMMESNIKAAIMASGIYCADQAKIQNNRLQTRRLPRDYGILNKRRISILMSKLLTECEKNAGRHINSQRYVLDQMNFRVMVPKHANLLKFEIGAEKVITSSRPLESIKEEYDHILPDLRYVNDTISMPKQLIYSEETIYPQSDNLNCSHPHTIFLHFDKSEVKNIHYGDVNVSQFQSRNMLKAFSVAAARAKQMYGDSSLNYIPRPVVVQSIHTDGRTFHFGVFQLNTLHIDKEEGPSNYWFHKPNQELFQVCNYSSGRPVLDGLNEDVFRHLYAFYTNS